MKLLDNKKVVMEIDIEEELANYIELLEYRVGGYRTIIKSLILNEEAGYNVEIYNKFMQEYQMYNREYNILINNVKQQYIPEQYQKSNYQLMVDFNNNQLVIVEDGGVMCHV